MSTTENNLYYNIKNNQFSASKDLEDFVNSLNNCEIIYEICAKVTQSKELRTICNNYAAERSHYASSLHCKLSYYTTIPVNYSDIIGGVNHAWINIIQGMNIQDDIAMLNAIILCELTAVNKYDTYLYNHIPRIEHLQLLLQQRDSIKQTIEEIKSFQIKHGLHGIA